MPPRRLRSPAEGCGQNGFALIIVLWTLVLIAFITAHLVASGRTEIKIARNLAANAVADAAVDGAVYQAIFQLLDPSPGGGLPLDGAMREFTIGDCRVAVQLFDEAARINPNLAAPELMTALLRVSGADDATAQRLAASIQEWTGNAGVPRQTEELAAPYRAAGLDYAPPGEPIETIDELQRVLGMTPALFAAIRPHLSLYAPAEPLLARADRVVVAAMAQTGAIQPPPAAAQRSPMALARIAAVAHGPGNARAARTVIARTSTTARNFAILSWRGDTE